MNKNKAKGTAAETAVLNFFKEMYPETKPMRVPLAGNRDMGDIVLFHGTDFPMIIEVKSGAHLNIPEWLRQLETEVHNYQQFYELSLIPDGFLFIKPKGVGVTNVRDYWVIQRVGRSWSKK